MPKFNDIDDFDPDDPCNGCDGFGPGCIYRFKNYDKELYDNMKSIGSARNRNTKKHMNSETKRKKKKGGEYGSKNGGYSREKERTP